MNQDWKNTNLSFEERTANLVSQMTLEEKVSQMTYSSSALPRFGIPEYNWWNECLHGVARAGVATVFPQAIGLASMFDEDLMKKIASVISDEARIKHHEAEAQGDHGIYKGLTMWSPNINIFRDPRWGRGHETYGEDPYLTSRLACAFIEGLQGQDDKYLKCVATAKHFAVHSGPENLRHEFDVHPSRKDLYETYLYAFDAAVRQAHVYSVMGAYNRVNGEPCCGSHTLLEEILRREWGFDGYVVSDCGAVEDFYTNHKTSENAVAAAAAAVNNGCDLCCGWVYPRLMEAVKQGLVSEETVDKAVYRLILARMRLGMFDPPENQPYTHIPEEKLDCREHHELSLQAARESIVLLKNDGVLPLNRKALHTIAVIGPNADSREALLGNYCGTASETYTVLEGIRARAGSDTRILFAEGCALTGGSAEEPWGEEPTYRFAEAKTAAEKADVILLVLGLNGEKEGEEGYGSGDRDTMNLPRHQSELAKLIGAVQKPKILINMTGSATTFPWANQYDAILQAWYPGQMGGLAAAELLFGDACPCARLPVTFYRSLDQLPDMKEYSMAGGTYRFLKEKPAYPFGYGLSYTSFAYEKLSGVWDENGVQLQFTLRNTGKTDGKEVTQIYLLPQPLGEQTAQYKLVCLQCTRLKAGESRDITLKIASRELSCYDDDGHLQPPADCVTLSVGGGLPDERTEELTGRAVARLTLPLYR